MNEAYILILAPVDLHEEMLETGGEGIPDNPDLHVEAVAARRGDPVSIALAVVGIVANFAGVVTFVDWSIQKWRKRRSSRKPATLKIITTDGKPASIEITAEDGEDAIRNKVESALTSATN